MARWRSRLLPALILVVVLSLSVRVNALWQEASQAFASPIKPAPPAAVVPALPPLLQIAADTPVPDKPAPDAKSADGKPADAKPADAKPADAKPGGDPLKPAAAQTKFSPAEIDLLQDLSNRRNEIDKRAEELDRRELLLKASEQRVDEKIAKLEGLKKELLALANQVDDQQNERIKQLVNYYSAMKPEEAAKILSTLEMPVLIQILTQMKDLKAAAVMAKMDPATAKDVTLEYAKHKPLPDLKTD